MRADEPATLNARCAADRRMAKHLLSISPRVADADDDDDDFLARAASHDEKRRNGTFTEDLMRQDISKISNGLSR